ncbi:WD repeat-containing protein 27, partial [Rhizophlyctis rosea]
MISATHHLPIPHTSFSIAPVCTLSTTYPLRPSNLAAAHNKIAIPTSKTQITFHNTTTIYSSDIDEVPEIEEILDTSHPGKISSLRFGNRPSPKLLLAASTQGLTIFTQTLSLSPSAPLLKSSKQWVARFLKRDLSSPDHLAVNADDRWVACCTGDSVQVVDAKTGKWTCLEGHMGRATCAEFCGREETRSFLITVSEDRTFKVWDIATPSLIYQSPIISPYAFTTLSFDPIRPRFVIGSEDGKLRFYDMTSRQSNLSCEPRCLTTFDAHGVWMKEAKRRREEEEALSAEGEVKVVCSLPIWKRRVVGGGEESVEVEEADGEVEHSAAILGLFYSGAGVAGDGLTDVSMRLYVGMGKGMLVMDPVSYHVLFHIDLEHDITRGWDGEEGDGGGEEREAVVSAGMYAFASPKNVGNGVLVLIGNSMTSEVTAMAVRETVAKTKDSTLAPIDISKYSILADLIRDCADRHVGGVWAKNVFENCINDLMTLGISEFADLSPEAVNTLPTTIPSYLRTTLALYLRQTIPSERPPSTSNLSFEAAPDITVSKFSPLRHYIKPRVQQPKPAKPTPKKPPPLTSKKA